MKFATEHELTAMVLGDAPIWDALGYSGWDGWGALEVDGFFGVPDLVLAFGKHDRLGRRLLRTIAFEMKLKDWKRALSQAFRYRAFAQCSYVVMDQAFVGRAVASIESFQRADIGLVSVSHAGAVSVHHRPRVRSPYAAHLRRDFQSLAASNVFADVRPQADSDCSLSDEVRIANIELNRRLTRACS